VVGDLIGETEFHPEKSSKSGLGLYENFLSWARA
jgi:imidazoleglycerol phosphate synthase glutamine amidotransferase subunit HisH